jgi:cytochrome b561
MPKKSWVQNLGKARYIMDVVLLVGFVLVCIPQTTGIPIHEWASVIFLVPLVIHILLHWDWIQTLPKQLKKHFRSMSTFNAIWDFLFYLAMLMVTLSGFLISESMFPFLGIPLEITPFWQSIHNGLGNLLMPMLGIHLALHWSWIKGMTKKMLGSRRASHSNGVEV